MNQLFLAVLKAVTGCCKGCSLSRYGPARAEVSVSKEKNVVVRLLPLLEAPAPPPAIAAMATFMNEWPLLPPFPRGKTRKACLRGLFRIGRKTTQCYTALLRMPGFNAFEAPLLQEGVYR